MITPDGAITRCLFLSTSDPFLTKRLLAEVCALAIGLLPDLGVGLQEIDEVAGRDAEESGRIGNAALAGSQDVECHANRRPEAHVLGREMEPAISVACRGVIQKTGNGFGSAHFGWQFVAEVEEEAVPEPLERLGFV